MDCIKDIVGVTKLDCNCATGNLTPEQKEALAKSNSGFYFLDNIPDALQISAIKYADECQSFYELAMAAKKAAEITFMDDVVAGLSLKYKSSKGKFSGTVGRTQYAGNLPAMKDVQFLKVESNSDKNDAVMTVRNVKIYSNTAGASKLYVLDSDLVILKEQDINLNANNTTTVIFTEPLNLPLVTNGSAAIYYFAWENVEGGQPKDNKLKCNCPGGTAYEEYLTASGGQADNLSELENAKTDLTAHGVVLTVEIACLTSNFICRQYDKDNAIAVVAKWAVSYKANEDLIERVLKSKDVSRTTLMSREHLYGKRNHFRAEYQSRIEYILQNVDVNSSNCFLCKDTAMYVGGILS